MTSVIKLLANWRATHEPGESIGSKGAFKYDIQRQCANELESALLLENQVLTPSEEWLNEVARRVEQWLSVDLDLDRDPHDWNIEEWAQVRTIAKRAIKSMWQQSTREIVKLTNHED